MTAAAASGVCRCGHDRSRHGDEIDLPCAAAGCGCAEYEPPRPPRAVVDGYRPPCPPPPSRAADACRCGHPKTEHEHDGLAPQCVAPACSCLRYRDPHAAPPPPPPPPPRLVAPLPAPRPVALAPAPAPSGPPTVEQILTAAARSESKRTAALGEKITALVTDLRARLAEERDNAEKALAYEAWQTKVKAEVVKLETALQSARAELRRHAKAPAAKYPAGTDGTYPCPDCGKTFAKAQGLGPHRALTHGHKKATG